MNELQQLLRVQTQLDDYLQIVDALNGKHLSDYSVVISKGSMVCESMLLLLVEQKGYKTDMDNVIMDDPRGIRRIPLLGFCRQEKSVLPEECREFVALIGISRNQAAHVGATYDMVVEFSKAMDYFTRWFKINYLAHADIDESSKKKISDRFFSLESKLSNVSSDEKEEAIFANGNQSVEEVLLKRIGEQTELILILSKQVNSIDERSERIEAKVDEIDRQIKQLSLQIEAYQSLVARQIERANTEDEVNRLISAYADECVERIVDNAHRITEDRVFEQEKRKLIISLGLPAWNKMESASQTFLISAKVMYNHLILLNDIVDYSGVCVLVTKALEVELAKRFYSNFLKYLDQKYQHDYSKYPTALLFQGKTPLLPEKFTMGNVAFVLCYLEDKYNSPQSRQNNKTRLLEYSKERLFSRLTLSEIDVLLQNYAKEIERIRKKYRNPSAHTNELKQVDAEECFNLVLDVEKFLKQMLDSYDS